MSFYGPQLSVIDVYWTYQVNMLRVQCQCGKVFDNRIDRWRIKCPICGRNCGIDMLRNNFVRREKRRLEKEELDSRAGAVWGKCRCPMTDGVHDTYCPTNNEYEYYRCIRCGAGVPQYSMALGMCQVCQKETRFGEQLVMRFERRI